MEINPLSKYECENKQSRPLEIEKPNKNDTIDVQEDIVEHDIKDTVELSEEAQLLAKLKDVPDIRSENIAELKELMQEQRYLTQEKIKLGVRRMLLMLFGE